MKKVLKRIGLTILVLLIVLVAVIALFAAKNMKAMNNTLDIVKDQLSQCGTLTRQNHEYEKIKLYGILSFDVEKYTLEGVGNVSVMTTNMGFMQMGTLVVTPMEKDVPLLSTDFMYMFGNRKYIMEMDNIMVNDDDAYRAKCQAGNDLIATYTNLEEYPGEPSWLDEVQDVLARKQSKDTAAMDKMVADVTGYYVNWVKEAPALSAEEVPAKVAAAKAYSDKLIDLGGLSTNVFKQALGEDVTRDFFDTVFFGTK